MLTIVNNKTSFLLHQLTYLSQHFILYFCLFAVVTCTTCNLFSNSIWTHQFVRLVHTWNVLLCSVRLATTVNTDKDNHGWQRRINFTMMWALCRSFISVTSPFMWFELTFLVLVDMQGDMFLRSVALLRTISVIVRVFSNTIISIIVCIYVVWWIYPLMCVAITAVAASVKWWTITNTWSRLWFFTSWNQCRQKRSPWWNRRRWRWRLRSSVIHNSGNNYT